MKAEIVYRDDWLAVVEKPPGLVVHAAPSHHGDTLVDQVAGLTGGDPARPGIVHRLDRDTSGLMVVALSQAAHADLSNQVRWHQVEREYRALCEGHLESRSGTIDAPIGRDPRDPTKMAVAGRSARVARTHFTVIEVLPQDTLLQVRLETGRTHQIRTHFAAIGHPLVGDPRYGSKGRHGLERQFLHSRQLAFRHPVTRVRLSFESALPADLREALDLAREE